MVALRWSVLHHKYILGVLTSYQQPLWDALLQAYCLSFPQGSMIQKATLTECVLAAHHLHNACCSHMETLRMRGINPMPVSGRLGADPIPRTGIG